MWSKNLLDSSLVPSWSTVSSPHCTSPGTPPPRPWGSSSQGWSGSETLLFWWTGWCGSHSSPRQWCAPAARSPALGGTLGSRWRHGSKWLRAPRLIFLGFFEKETHEGELCLILCESALLRHNRAVLAMTVFLEEVHFINAQNQQESNAAY